MQKIKKLKFLLLVIALMIPLMSLKASAADTNKNYTKVRLRYATDSSSIPNQQVKIAGKTYTTDKDGWIQTDMLSYGKYPVEILPVKDPGSKNEPDALTWKCTAMGQKVTIDRYSHMPLVYDMTGNVYAYRDFQLNVSIVNSLNEPARNIKISVLNEEGTVPLFSSTVGTCMYGIISFDWAEMPGSSSVNNGVTIGQYVTIVTNSLDGKYKETRKKVKLDTNDIYTKMVVYKEGEAAVTFKPGHYEVERYDVNSTTAAIHMIYTRGIKALGTTASNGNLDPTMFTLKAGGTNVPVKEANYNVNTLTLTYDKASGTPTTVGYNGDGREEGYLVSELNDDVRVDNFSDKEIASVYSNTGAGKDLELLPYEQEVLKLVNEERVRAGLNTLTLDPELSRMARIKSNDMAFNGYLGHLSPVYKKYHEQAKMFGYNDFTTMAENVALMPLSRAGSDPKAAANAAFTGWKNSPGHYANMLKKDASRIGIGFCPEGGTWTQLFADTRDQEIYTIKGEVKNFGGKVAIETNALLNSPVKAIATPGENYKFSRWVDKDAPDVTLSTKPMYEFNVTKNITLVAEFVTATYDYTTSVKTYEYVKGIPTIIEAVGGTATGGGTGFLTGKDVSFSAKPEQGFMFVGWYFDEFKIEDEVIPAPNSRSLDYTIKAGKDTTMSAVFKRIASTQLYVEPIDAKYKAKITGPNTLRDLGTTPDANAIYGVKPTGAFAVKTASVPEDGKSYNLSDIPNGFSLTLGSYDDASYKFMYWQESNTGDILEKSEMDGIGEYQNTGMMYVDAQKKRVKPIFDETPYVIKNTTTSNGIVKGLGEFGNNTSVNVTAVANSGYEFSHWADLATTDAQYGASERTIEIKNTKRPNSYNINLKPVFVQIAKDQVVSIEANIADVGSQFGAGNYFTGQAATAMASVKDTRYKFIGWYNKADGQLLYSNPIYSFIVPEGGIQLEARYEMLKAPYTLTVTGIGEGGEANPLTPGKVMSEVQRGNSKVRSAVNFAEPTGYFYLDQVKLEATPNADYTFVGWYQNGREVSINKTCEITIYSNTEIEAKFVKNTEFVVTFQDFDGRVISAQNIAQGGKAIEPANVSRPGYTFKGWDTDAWKKVQYPMFVTAVYEKNADILTVEVIGGVIAGRGSTSGNFTYANAITINADAPIAGEKFSHWEKAGIIVSYDMNYKFAVTSSGVYNAVYTNDGNQTEVVPLAVWTDEPSVNEETKKISFPAQITVPTPFTLLECGVVLAESSKYVPEFTLETPGIVKGKSSAQSSVGTYIIAKSKVEPGATWYGRVYLVYKDAEGNIFTMYSDEKFAKMPELAGK